MALKINRKVGQKIIILTPQGDTIEITFAGKEGNQGKILIDAPRHVVVARKELDDLEALKESAYRACLAKAGG